MMKIILIIICLLLSPLLGRADVITTPLPIQSPGLALEAGAAEMLSSSVWKMIDHSDDSFCTVFAVSTDGYMMTALHCLRRCLSEQGVLQQASNTYLGLLDLMVSTSHSAVGMRCPHLSIPGLRINADSASAGRQIEVVATGRGLSIFDERFFGNTALYQKLKASGWADKAQDFAILKVVPVEPLRCLKFAATPAGAGNAVFSVGFPLSDSNEELSLSASQGHLYVRADESGYYASQNSDLKRAWVNEQFNAPGVLYSNAWNNVGQSGGPIVTAGGQVIGITSGFTAWKDDQRVDRHELVGGGISSVLSSVSPTLAEMIRIKNAACGN